MPRLLLSLFSVAVALCVACNTFDPELGTTPFKCGASAPRCPDGYSCVQNGTNELCVVSGQDPSMLPDGGPDGSFSCNDDSAIESNDTLPLATPTGIPDQASTRLVGLAICPLGDTDLFEIQTPTGMNNVKISTSIELGNGDGELRLEILDDLGASQRQGMPDAMNPSIITAEITGAPASEVFFIRVTGDGVAENNYNIDISATR